MFTLFLLYGIIIFTLSVGAFFVVYHILRYSLTQSLGYFGALTFGGIFLFLLLVNFLSFQSLGPETLLPALTIGPLTEIPATQFVQPKSNPW